MLKFVGYMVIYYIVNILICLGFLVYSDLNMMGVLVLEFLSENMVGMFLFLVILEFFCFIVLLV